MSRTRDDLLGLAASLGICFAVAAVGAAASVNARAFYADLVKPGWAPPGAVFGPVWTILYILMAIAAWRVWCLRASTPVRLPLALFATQLALNGLWSWVFFQWHEGALAFANVVVLWLLILAVMVLFWRKSRLAGALLLPYLAWVSVASALTYYVWRHNPLLLGT
jgi:translocator protein